MADQKVIITSTNTNGQTLQKTLTDINPDAGNTELKTFAQMLNGLTDNTYGKTDRVIKINCDTESGGGAKQTPTLTLSKTSCTTAEISSAAAGLFLVTITTDSDGALYVKFDSSLALGDAACVSVLTENGNTYFLIRHIQDSLPAAQTIIIGQAESETYKAAEVTFTITA